MAARIPIGSHLVSPRLGYTHHGIYIGRGRVVHYSGKSNGLDTGPVQVATIENFAQGRGYMIKTHRVRKFDGKQISDRARMRIGEDLYSLIGNNCEHFCEWCISDEHRSLQVEKGARVGQASFSIAGVGRPALSALTPLLAASKIPYPPVVAVGVLLSIGLLAYKLVSPKDDEV